jgi:hypothetical protein
MGWRTISIFLAERPPAAVSALLRQVVDLADYHGLEGILTEPVTYPGEWEFIIQENSSLLNALTPDFAEAVHQIAVDIQPGNHVLAGLADEVQRQLVDQLVDHSDADSVRVARRGQQFQGLAFDDASPAFHSFEIGLHRQRLEDAVATVIGAAGPTAWRVRRELQPRIRVDALALLMAVRRLRRSGQRLLEQLPGGHLKAAVQRFDEALPDLVLVRDIAEHIDEYTIGSGRRDGPGAEPGPVFSVLIGDSDEVTVAARGASVGLTAAITEASVLAGCLQESIDHYLVYRLMPGLADFEFVRYIDGAPTVIAPEDEDAQHEELRRAMERLARSTPSPKPCGTCGEPL